MLHAVSGARRHEAAARCWRKQALHRGVIGLAQQSVTGVRLEVLSGFAREHCVRRAMGTWWLATSTESVNGRARAARAIDVAEQFWRLRSLFGGFALMVEAAA
jgi:hypothetical protein